MNKNFKAENPCNMDLLSGGGGGTRNKGLATEKPKLSPGT